MDKNLKEMTKVITKTERLLRPGSQTDLHASKEPLTIQDLARTQNDAENAERVQSVVIN